jgi:CRP-like cAMP-binding protein
MERPSRGGGASSALDRTPAAVHPHEVVFQREDPADSLRLVSKGRFAIQIMTPRGDTVTIGIRGPGDSFGEMALVADGRKRSATVEALEEAETFAVYVADFRRLRRGHPSLNQVLIGFLAEELDRQNELLLEALRSGRAAGSASAGGAEFVLRGTRLGDPAHAGAAGRNGGHVAGDRQPSTSRGAGAGNGGSAGETAVLHAEAITRRAR